MSGGVHIYVRRGEAAAKCTIRPLRGTAGLSFHAWPPRAETMPPEGALVLAPGGAPLGPGDAGVPLVLLDASWRHAAKMLNELQRRSRGGLATRALPGGWRTAYPRRAKSGSDPDGGLATVEALYAALATVGSPLLSRDLLAHYAFAEEFLALNEGMPGCRNAEGPWDGEAGERKGP